MPIDQASLFWFLLAGQRHEIERAFGLLKVHNSSIEVQLKKEGEDFSEWLKREADNLAADKRDELYEWYGEDLMILADDLPNIQRRAMFLSSYTLLEHHLNEYCKLFHNRGGITLKLDEVAGQGIERAKIYLKKVIGIPFPMDQAQWNEIMHFNRIRNVLVHRNGEINENADGALVNYAKSSTFVRVTHSLEIYLEGGLIEHVSSVLEAFFQGLYDALHGRFQQLVADNALKADLGDAARPSAP